MQILIFKDKKSADDAIAIINTKMGLPKKNSNALTKAINDDAQGTDSWAISTECLSGEYFIPKPEKEFIDEKLGDYREESYDYKIHEIFTMDSQYVLDKENIRIENGKKPIPIEDIPIGSDN